MAGFWYSEIGEGGEEDNGVKRLYWAVIRGRRDGVFGFFGLETISAHDIGFFDVAGIVAHGVIAAVCDATGVGGNVGVEGANGDKVDEVGNAIVEDGEGGFLSLVDFVDLACFVRIYLCSLVLLGYFSRHCC